MVALNIQPDDQDDLEGIGDVERLSWWPRFFANSVCALLAALFTWLQIREYQVAQFFEHAKPNLIFKLALITFYLSWLFGPTFDLRIQQLVYIRDPHKGAVAPLAFVLLILFSGSAFFMLWASNDERTFALSLTIFFVLNVAGYLYIFRRTRPVIAESGKVFWDRKNYYRFEQLLAVTKYMFGRWQTVRFGTMAVAVVALDTVCLSASARTLISTAVRLIFVDLHADILFFLLPGFSLLLFVCVSEGWIWAERIRVRNSILFIEQIRRKYSIEPLPARSY